MLNELQQKMSMGLESKEGALRALGEEFPEEKLQEIRTELIEDAKSEGSLNLVRAQISKQLMDLTGMMVGPDGTATPMDPLMMPNGDVMGDGQLGPQGAGVAAEADQAVAQEQMQGEDEIRNSLVAGAYGTQLPTRRAVDKD
jgi:hypothetical protein